MLVTPTSTLLADEFPVVVLLGGVNAGIALDRTSTDNSRKQTGPHPRRSRRGYAEEYDTNRDRITDSDALG